MTWTRRKLRNFQVYPVNSYIKWIKVKQVFGVPIFRVRTMTSNIKSKLGFKDDFDRKKL